MIDERQKAGGGGVGDIQSGAKQCLVKNKGSVIASGLCWKPWRTDAVIERDGSKQMRPRDGEAGVGGEGDL